MFFLTQNFLLEKNNENLLLFFFWRNNTPYPTQLRFIFPWAMSNLAMWMK